MTLNLAGELIISGVSFNIKYIEWIKDGKFHRDDGPAVIYANGYQAWLKDGERHRDDGPSVIFGDYCEYWLHGTKIE